MFVAGTVALSPAACLALELAVLVLLKTDPILS